VIVNDDYSRELGVRFGATAANDNGGNGLIGMTGSGIGAGAMVGSPTIGNTPPAGSALPVPVPPLATRYNVNLPVASPAGSIALAILGNDYLVDLELSALQAEGDGRVVSSPRIVATNQREARILQGRSGPGSASSSSGAATTSFKEAVLSLTVTPQITPDDRIIMDLTVTKDSVGELVPQGVGGFIPSIDTRELMTQVVVNDGETVVLGYFTEPQPGIRAPSSHTIRRWWRDRRWLTPRPSPPRRRPPPDMTDRRPITRLDRGRRHPDLAASGIPRPEPPPRRPR